MELHKHLRKEKGFPVNVYVEYGATSGVKELIPITDISNYTNIEISVFKNYIRDTPIYNFEELECVTLMGLFNIFMNLREYACPDGEYDASEEVNKLLNKFLHIHNGLSMYIENNNKNQINAGGIKWQ